MKKISFIFITIFLFTIAAYAAKGDTTIIIEEHHHKKGMIKATGIGYPPSRISDERQARLLARRAAIVDGYRNLLKSFDNLSNWIENRSIIKRENSFLRGAKILDTRYFSDGRAEVDLGLDIALGRDGLRRLKSTRYKIIYVSEITGKPYEVITKEEWIQLIGKGR